MIQSCLLVLLSVCCHVKTDGFSYAVLPSSLPCEKVWIQASCVTNLLHVPVCSPFRRHWFSFCSAVGGRPSACLSDVARGCLPVLPSAIASSLSLVNDVGGAGNAGLFSCVGDVACAALPHQTRKAVCVVRCLSPICCFFPFCGVDALLVAGVATGVVRVGVGSADDGVFHGPVFAQARSC